MNMQARTPFEAVEGSERPEYPIGHKVRLDSHFFVEWQFNRVLNSRLRLLAEPEVRAIAYELMWVSQNQSPVGTLPTDERELAALAGVDLQKWHNLCKLDISPLYNWREYRCDNKEVRYGHPVVVEMAEKAIGLKAKNAQDRELGRERKRLMALPDKVVRAGGHSEMAQNDAYISQLDQILLESFEGQNRTVAVVRQAMEALELRRG